jgi:hypothetical protein
MFGKTRLTAVALGGAVALATVGAVGGVAYAAATSHTITVCVRHNGGGLYRARHCAVHDSQLSWNSQGPRGPRGLSLFARVDETGKLHQHSAGVTATKDPAFTGVYHVDFPQNISACAAVVSQGEASNNGFFPGVLYEAVVQSDPNNSANPHEINVYPTDVSGSPKNAGFDLIVAC